MCPGPPATVEIFGLPNKTKDIQVTIKWNKPQDNGDPIKLYRVYQRIVSDDGTIGEWKKINEIKDLSKQQVNISLDKNRVYEFAVTATNKHGESLRDGNNVKRLEVFGGR